MSERRVITGLTLSAAALAVVVMAIWGLDALTAPVDDGGGDGAADTLPCPPQEQQIREFVTRGEVTVSVYNTGKRSGRAQDTLAMLEDAGFTPGEVGNAADGDDVRRAEVRTTVADDPAARLVARAMGRGTRVVVTASDRGPGIDVFIGDKFGGLNQNAPRRVRLPQAETTCS